MRLITICIFFLIINSCSNTIEINHPSFYKIIKDKDGASLETIEGKEILKKEYAFISVVYFARLDENYVVYGTKDDRIGFFFNNLNKPYVEFDKKYKNIEFIDSKKYFVFRTYDNNELGYASVGVIDKEGNQIIKNDYDKILHDGNELFFASDLKNNMYAIFDINGKKVSPNEYKMIYSRHGLSFGAKQFFDGYCIIDKKGQEATDFKYKDIAIHKCELDPSKIYFHSTENGINKLHYANGEIIYESKTQILPMVSYLRKTYKFVTSKYPKKEFIGVFVHENEKHLLTYEGEIIKIEK